jgi:cyanophycinase
MTFIKDYQLNALLKKKFREGVIFGGTSAGTAIMSNPMLTGETDLTIIKGSQVGLSEGLGLLPLHIIVDQHFVVRQRFNRLAGLILDKAEYTGIGIDENNAFLIRGNIARMIGATQVIIFQKTGSNKLNLTILGPGQTFQL